MSKRLTIGPVEEAWRNYLDEMDPRDLFSNYSNARLLEEVDPVAYRVGINDWSASFPCVECGLEFCVDDPWNSDGRCDECAEEDDDE